VSIPATGALGIMTCPNGACSGIASVVCGGAVGGGQSLKNLLNIATLGNNMSNFHSSTYGDLTVAPLLICSISSAGAVTSVNACSYSPNTFTTSTACTWLHPAAPSAPSIAGTSQSITVDANAGAARAGTVCYIPSHCGSIQTLTINQLVGITWKCINMGTTTSSGCGTATNAWQCGALTSTPALAAGETYTLSYAFNGSCGSAGGGAYLCITCNAVSKLACCVNTPCASSSGSFVVSQGNTVIFCVIVHKTSGTRAAGYIGISSITAGTGGDECYGGGCCNVCAYTS
jgi:hypothetical protein